jgi:uncharacterized membrane protein YkoI
MKHSLVVILIALLMSVSTVLAQQTNKTNEGVDREAAERIALAQYPNTVVSAVDFTCEGGIAVWDVMLDNGMAVYINVHTGRIMDLEPWHSDWYDNRTDFAITAQNPHMVHVGSDGVDINEAETIALSYYPDATVVEVDITRKNKVRVWDVMLDNGMAVYINAQAGTVIELELWQDERRSEAFDTANASPLADFPGGCENWVAQPVVTPRRYLASETLDQPPTVQSVRYAHLCPLSRLCEL